MKSKKNNARQTLSKYAEYSSIGFQMIAIIGVFTYIGYRIDQSSTSDKMIWTAIFALLGVCLSIYTTIRMVTRNRPPRS